MRSTFLWLFLLFWVRLAFGDAKIGTGFIISPDGYVLTNNHVISGATVILVNIPGLGHGNAELVAADPYKDLALLKLTYNNLPYLPIAESRNVQVLDSVIVLGYPLATELGLDISASQGQVNSIREEGRIPLLQIDANVNVGNSGGPVLNDKGEVVGIVVSKLDAVEVLKDTGSIPERTNFAIPIDEARAMVRKAYPFGFTPSARTERLLAQDVVRASKGATVLVYSAIHSEQPLTPPPATSAPDPRASVLEFINTFWYHNIGNDPGDWASDFAAEANYCYYDRNGLADRAYIRYDRAKLVDRYPVRHYRFSAPTIYMEPGDNAARVTYSFTYSYAGRKSAAGYCRVSLNVQYISGRWLISDYDEKVDRQ